MKKFFKSILAAMLCVIIAISAVGTTTAQAAEDTTIKVTFKKKNVKFKLKDTGVKKVSYKTLKKKWGKPSETNKGEYGAEYFWRKGKTEIRYLDVYDKPQFSNYCMTMEDKNGTVCGIKVGMKKDKAIEILEEMDATIDAETKDYVSAIFIDGALRTQMNCTIKKGKVIRIWAMMYIEE